MNDVLDVDLNDPELGDEIRLVAELMAAASASLRHLSPGTIDDILWQRPAS